VKIAHLIQRPQRRGAEIFAHQLSAWLTARGDSSSVIALYSGPHMEILGNEGAAILGDEASVFEKAVDPRTLYRVADEIAARSPDMVLVHGARTVKYGAVLARLWPRRRWRLVYRNIDRPLFWVRGRVRRFVYARGVMASMDGVVAISDGTRRELVALGAQVERTTVIGNAVDVTRLDRHDPPSSQRKALGVLDDELVLVFVGALGPQKRPDRFVAIVRALRERGLPIRGVIVGDGSWSRMVVGWVQDAGLEHFVTMVGNVPDVGSLLAASDLLVSCSDTEGMPGVVLEAGALAVPVVAFDVGGIRECVDDGVDGVVVPAADVDGLVNAAEGLLRDPARRRRLGEAARTRVRTMHTLDVVGSAYRSFFERVCGR
jgi:glycosyltransferase involved in cell wall biosynthesis